MNIEDIIRMAKECGLLDINYEIGEWDIHEVTSFASLIASAEREFYMQLFLDPENQPTQFGTATQEYREQEVREAKRQERDEFKEHALAMARAAIIGAVKNEREACAKLCEDSVEYAGDTLAQAIRARGQA